MSSLVVRQETGSDAVLISNPGVAAISNAKPNRVQELLAGLVRAHHMHSRLVCDRASYPGKLTHFEHEHKLYTTKNVTYQLSNIQCEYVPELFDYAKNKGWNKQTDIDATARDLQILTQKMLQTNIATLKRPTSFKDFCQRYDEKSDLESIVRSIGSWTHKEDIGMNSFRILRHLAINLDNQQLLSKVNDVGIKSFQNTVNTYNNLHNQLIHKALCDFIHHARHIARVLQSIREEKNPICGSLFSELSIHEIQTTTIDEVSIVSSLVYFGILDKMIEFKVAELVTFESEYEKDELNMLRILDKKLYKPDPLYYPEEMKDFNHLYNNLMCAFKFLNDVLKQPLIVIKEQSSSSRSSSSSSSRVPAAVPPTSSSSSSRVSRASLTLTSSLKVPTASSSSSSRVPAAVPPTSSSSSSSRVSRASLTLTSSLKVPTASSSSSSRVPAAVPPTSSSSLSSRVSRASLTLSSSLKVPTASSSSSSRVPAAVPPTSSSSFRGMNPAVSSFK